MNTVAQLVHKSYSTMLEKVKEDLSHISKDAEMMVAALDKLTLKEQRPAMLILVLQYIDRFSQDQQKEMMSFVFDMTSDDMDTLTVKVHSAMSQCSEPQTRKHPIQSLLDILAGKKTKDSREDEVS